MNEHQHLDETEHSHRRQLDRPGFERLLFGKTAPLADHPIAAVIHPGEHLGAERDRREDVDLVIGKSDSSLLEPEEDASHDAGRRNHRPCP